MVMRDLIEGLKSARNTATPILLKIAPDVSAQQIDMIAGIALDTGLDGLIISNTTLDRPAGVPTFSGAGRRLVWGALNRQSLGVS